MIALIIQAVRNISQYLRKAETERLGGVNVAYQNATSRFCKEELQEWWGRSYPNISIACVLCSGGTSEGIR
jgi:hypothetical protein